MTCENCRALYARIERADRVMTALKPLIDSTVTVRSGACFLGPFTKADLIALIDAFNMYVSAELDARIAEARTDEPAPPTLRAIDEIVERSR